MGMFDSLIVNCPRCGSEVEFQSKAGECSLARYNLWNVPKKIAADLEGEKEQCTGCMEFVEIKAPSLLSARIYKDDSDPTGYLDV